MNQKDFIVELLEVLDTVLPTEVDIRVRGGDQDTSPPEAILEWNANGLSDANGHSPYGGTQRDSSGNAQARELHQYYEMEVRIYLRLYDEIKKDELATDVASKLLQFQDDATKFHKDTRQWQAPDVRPSSNPAIDPDWYESVILVTTQYMMRSKQEEEDALEGVVVEVINDEPDERNITIN